MNRDIFTKRLRHIKTIMKERKYSEALSEVKKLISKEPNSAFLYNVQGEIFLGLKKYEKALESYKKCVVEPDLKLNSYLNIGLIKGKLNDFEGSIESYNKALIIQPNHTGALNNLGNIYEKSGQYEKAISHLKQVLLVKPQHVGAYNNMALALKKSGNILEAINYYKKALEIEPSNFSILNKLGLIYMDDGQLEEALFSFTKAHESNPKSVTVLCNLADAFVKTERVDEAIIFLKTAKRINKVYAPIYSRLGSIFKKIDKYKLSVLYFKKALKLDPKSDSLYNNLGVALQALKKFKEAIKYYKKAVRINPKNFKAFYNMGTSQTKVSCYNEAINCFNKALEIESDFADAYFGIGRAFAGLGNQNEALINYRKTLTLNSKHSKALRSMAWPYILQYKFIDGWKHYEYRWKEAIQRWPIKDKDLWEGQKNKRIVLWREQGIGDDLLFLGLVQEAFEKSKSICVYTLKRLIPLCKRSMPGINFKEYKEKIEEEVDYHLPMGSLPRLFRNSEKDFDRTVKGYLKADKNRVELLREELGLKGKRVIGISWKSFKGSNMDKKNIELMELAPVFKDLDVVFLNLQYGDVDKEIREFKKATGIEILQCASVDNREDLDGLAALIETCDLVVSTSNVTIHLAGALAKETWVLLPFVANLWWFTDRSDSLWYPTLKLYRQKKLDNWIGICRKMKDDLFKKFD